MPIRPEAPKPAKKERSEFLDALKQGVVIGTCVLAIALPAMWVMKKPDRVAQPPVAQQTVPAPAPAPAPPVAQAPEPEAPATLRLADLGTEQASEDVKLVANWAAHTRDHKNHAFVVIDKKNAHLYVFGPDAKLKDSTPILLGKATGDHSVPGIGTKPLSLVKEDEKTTPAGRFVAEPGKNTHGEDIIWVDYENAVSMHRLRKVKEEEQRAARLASPTKADNRISFGCINIPHPFYNNVLDPTVKKQGAIVYVLPEQWTLQKTFGAYDVTQPQQAARAAQAAQRS